MTVSQHAQHHDAEIKQTNGILSSLILSCTFPTVTGQHVLKSEKRKHTDETKKTFLCFCFGVSGCQCDAPGLRVTSGVLFKKNECFSLLLFSCFYFFNTEVVCVYVTKVTV